jgi:hypothetical protein
MASQGVHRRSSHLQLLLAGPTGYWLVVLALAAPWVRFELGAWTLYPGHVALTLLLAAVLLDEGGWLAALRPLWPLVALGAYVAGVAALRGEWQTAAIVSLATGAHFAWGAAALRLGMEREAHAGLREALLLGLALTVAMGLLAWLLQAAWPAACGVLNCRAGAHWPFPFTGGWGSAAQYALLLLILLPALAAPLAGTLRDRRGGTASWALPALVALAALGLVAGAPLWAVLLAALGWELLRRTLRAGQRDPRRDPQRLLLRGLAAGGLFVLVLVYGLEPGYLHRLWGNESALPPLRVTLAEPAPRRLSSDAPTLLRIALRNTGWSPIGGAGAQGLELHLSYLVTPERGTTRTVAGPRVPVGTTLAPGAARTVPVLLRVPHWVRDGYLTWHAQLADGSAVSLARRSLPGFRFSNSAYRRLGLDAENQLSSLAQRARAFQAEAQVAPGALPDAHAPGMVLGDVLDTLFFSPLWGEPEPGHAGAALSARRPFLPALLHQYGLIGLALALWVGARLLQRAAACADRGDPGWRLLPLALVLLFAAGLFTPVLSSYHSHWAVFVLAGFLEGRYARKYPWPKLRLPPRPLGSLRLRLPWRRGIRRSGAARRRSGR